MTNNNYVQIISEIFENGYIDDHNGRHMETNVVGNYVDEMDNHKVVYLDEECNFCVNPFYMGNDGKAHLDRASINGNVYTRNEGNLETAVHRFNDEHSPLATRKNGCTIGKIYVVRK